MRYTIFGWNDQAQVDVIRHRSSFHHFHPFLLTQLPDDPPCFGPQLATERFLAIFRDEHNMIFTVPFDMALAFPVVPCCLLFPGGFPLGILRNPPRIGRTYSGRSAIG